MNRNSIKTLGGWIVVLGHLIVLSWTALSGNLQPEQRRTIAWTLTPVLTIYFVALVKWISSDPDAVEGRTAVDFNVVFTSVLLPSILMLAALCLIITYPSSIAATGDALQQWIAGLEVALALAVGLVVDDLVPVTRAFKGRARVDARAAIAGATRHDRADVGGTVQPAHAIESDAVPAAVSRPA